MAKWKYKGEWYKSIPFNWIKVYYGKAPLDIRLEAWNPVVVLSDYTTTNDVLVYMPKHDKCYTIQRFGVMGNSSKLKMCLEDIYTKKHMYVMAKDVELVTRIKPKKEIRTFIDTFNGRKLVTNMEVDPWFDS